MTAPVLPILRSPVDAPVTDGFRAPATPYGPGNRGLDFDSEPGAPVRAAAEGVVAFAGPVAGRGVVAVNHRAGYRTTYTGLARIMVTTGDLVEIAQRIGSAGDTLHFGVRHAGVYVDPGPLLTRSGHPVLVAGD